MFRPMRKNLQFFANREIHIINRTQDFPSFLVLQQTGPYNYVCLN